MSSKQFKFRTVPEEMIEDACAYANYFQTHGYTIKVEPSELGYPFTPSMKVHREQTDIMVEVDSGHREERLEAWVRYARSLTRDTRIAIALQAGRSLSHTEEDKLREAGVGLYTLNQSVVERIAPRDIPVNVALPPLTSIHPKLRPLLGGVYEQFERSHWRAGFEDACKVLEREAARYLKRDIRSGRIVVLDSKGKPRKLTNKIIDKLTMGQLKDCFANIVSQNYADSAIAAALERVNKDRIGVVHRMNRAATENRLRKNVGQHMWVIIDALKVIQGLR